jgi:hypothetical protein
MTYPKATIESITTPVAQALLDRMVINRKLRAGHVERLAAAMRSGEYDGLNGETVKVDVQGRLVDGQHRLTAFLISGLSEIRLLVVRGVLESSKETIDQGIGRSPADVLAMNGYKGAFALAASARWLWIYDNDWPNGLGSRGASKINNRLVVKLVSEHPDLVAASAEVVEKYHKAVVLMTGSIAGFARLITSRLSPDDSNEFFDAMCAGEGGPRTKVVRLLRDRLMSRKSKSGRLVPAEIVVLTARVWNAFRENRDLTRLFIGKDTTNPYATAPRFE